MIDRPQFFKERGNAAKAKNNERWVGFLGEAGASESESGDGRRSIEGRWKTDRQADRFGNK